MGKNLNNVMIIYSKCITCPVLRYEGYTLRMCCFLNMLMLLAIIFVFHIIFSLNMSIFDMNPVSVTIFPYFAIFILDLKP